MWHKVVSVLSLIDIISANPAPNRVVTNTKEKKSLQLAYFYTFVQSLKISQHGIAGDDGRAACDCEHHYFDTKHARTNGCV